MLFVVPCVGERKPYGVLLWVDFVDWRGLAVRVV
jgi:hypothetical protein